MERLFENVEFYINTSGELRLRVVYINQETKSRIEKDIPVNIEDVAKTNMVTDLANNILEKAGI